MVITTAKDHIHEITIISGGNLQIWGDDFDELHTSMKEFNDLVPLLEMTLSYVAPNLYDFVITDKNNRSWTQQINSANKEDYYISYQTDSWGEKERTAKTKFIKLLVKLALKYDFTSFYVEFF